ncbi:MAG: peptidylprolyl isomerase [bacterium]
MQKILNIVLIIVVLIFAGSLIFKRNPASTENSDLNLNQINGASSAPKAEDTMTSPSPTKSLAKPAMLIDVKKTYLVTLHTTVGDIQIELDNKNTPITANNFYYLAKEGFYDNVIFHRTIPGFMIQGGDPTGTGAGSPGYKFADEPISGKYTRGTVAMANSGPDTNGSQFFIMHADFDLQPNYVIFGHVVSGLETVDKIATAPTIQDGQENSKPIKPVVIESTTITEK